MLSRFGASNGGCGLLDLCLTCGSCESRCPSDVKFTEFVREWREARGTTVSTDCAGGSLVEWMAAMMSNPRVSLNRLGWLSEGLRTSKRGDYLYFVGCNPVFQIAFEQREQALRDIPVAAVWMLNRMGIEPVVLPGERCCGHDQLWWGQRESFLRLARMNIEMIRESGAKVVVTTCPECQSTILREYPKLGLEGVRVASLLEVIAENLEPDAFREISEGVVVIQDSCRMTYHLGDHRLPREALGRVPGLKVVEFAESGPNAACCGASFHACNSVSSKIQAGRILEAQALGAQAVVTVCPKCLVHISCARDGEKLEMPVVDATWLLAESLGFVRPADASAPEVEP